MIETLGLFLAIFVGAYVVNAGVYLAMGAGLVALNRARAHAKLQPRRDGIARARAEILESLSSSGYTAFCLALALTLSLNGWGLWPAETWGLIPTVIALGLLIIGYDAWFYWAHRLL
ncbi:MAG: hypothetical protein AAF908_03160, partial [Pseudomonadota bacterium]